MQPWGGIRRITVAFPRPNPEHILPNRLELANISRCSRPYLAKDLETADRHPDLISCDCEIFALEQELAGRKQRQRPLADHAGGKRAVAEFSYG